MKTKVNVMKKVLGFVLTLVIMCSMLPMTSNAAGTTTVYLKPGTNWTSANARIVMYAFNNEGSAWADFSDTDGDGIFVANVGIENPTAVIFLRYAAGTTGYSWDYESNGEGHVWNRTGNITWPGNENNCYTIPNDWWGHENGNDVNSVVTAWSQDAWSHEVHDYVDGTCACGATYDNGIGAKLAGYSLSVAGNIGVNFYMELGSTVLADDTAYMKFTLPNGSTTQVLVNDAEELVKTINGHTYYVFPCEVAAKEMTSTITAQMITAQGNSTEYTYTVRDYADALIARSTNDAEKAFVKSMLNYGAASQTYFGFNTADLANKNLSEMDKTLPAGASIAESLATDYAAVATGTLGTFKSNLLLNSETTLKVYFTPAVGVEVESIKVDETPVELVKSGDDYVVAIEDINATEIDSVKTITVTATDDTTTTLSKCSPLAYGYSVLSTNDREALSNVIVALRLYNQAADAYVAN